MIWLLFIFSTTLFGASVILLICGRLLPFNIHVFGGWALGSMITSFLLYLIINFVPLSDNLIDITMILQAAFVMILLVVKKNLRVCLRKIRFEKSLYLYISYLLVGLITVISSRKVFENFPKMLPKHGRNIIENEYSFVNSVLFGVNRKHRNTFGFVDPNAANATYAQVQTLPLLYCCCLMKSGLDFADASLVISFMNSLSIVVGFYFFLKCFASNNQFLITLLCFLFSGGWGIFKLLSSKFAYSDYDFVHQCGKNAPTPHYQTFALHIIISKVSSFAIPMALFSMIFLQINRINGKNAMSYYILSGIFATFIPSTMTSISFFILAFCHQHAFIYLIPFTFSILPKLIGIKFRYFPVWREYQMRGIFFAHFYTYIESYGLPYIFMFFIPFRYKSHVLFQRFLSAFIPFLICSFFREGINHLANDLAVVSIFMPIVYMNYVNELQFLIRSTKDKMKGFTIFIFVMCIGICIGSGLVSMNRIFTLKIPGLNDDSIKTANWIKTNIHSDKTIITDYIEMNPASFSGYQVLLSDIDSQFKKGYSIQENVALIDKIHKSSTFAKNLMENSKIDYILDNRKQPFILQDKNELSYFTILFNSSDWVILKLKK